MSALVIWVVVATTRLVRGLGVGVQAGAAAPESGLLGVVSGRLGDIVVGSTVRPRVQCVSVTEVFECWSDGSGSCCGVQTLLDLATESLTPWVRSLGVGVCRGCISFQPIFLLTDHFSSS